MLDDSSDIEDYRDEELKYKYMDDSPDDGNETDESQHYTVDRFMDVNVIDKKLKYRVRWLNYASEEDTWEEETQFLKDTILTKMLNIFKEKNKEKIEKLQSSMKPPRKKRTKATKKPNWEYVVKEAVEDPEDLAPREMKLEDEFYGQTAKDAQGEVKKLFDPSHKTSATELLLAKIAPKERVTRHQMRQLLSERSRSSSLVRDSVSPSPEVINNRKKTTGRRGRPPGSTSSGAAKNRKRKIKQEEEDDVDSIYDAEVDSDDGERPPRTKHRDEISPHPVPSTSAWKDEPMDEPVNEPVDEPMEEQRESTTTSKPSSKARRKCNDFFETVDRFSDLSFDGLRFPYHCYDRSPTHQEFIKVIMDGNLDEFLRMRKTMSDDMFAEYVEYSDRYGCTLLHILCRSQRCDDYHNVDHMITEICEFKNKSYMDCKDFNGMTALHYAVEKGQICRALRLLLRKCSVNITNNENLTPLDIAYRNNHAKMVKTLLQSGANFMDLELAELQKDERMRKRRSYEVLTRHIQSLRQAALNARMKCFKYMNEENSVVFPMFCVPCSEGCFYTYRFMAPLRVPNDCIFLFVLHMCCFTGNDTSKWNVRCWSGVRLSEAPVLTAQFPIPNVGNVVSLQPAQHVPDPMVFFVPISRGENRIDIRLTRDECTKEMLLATIVAVKKGEPRVYQPGEWAGASGLEVAPLVGPMF